MGASVSLMLTQTGASSCDPVGDLQAASSSGLAHGWVRMRTQPARLAAAPPPGHPPAQTKPPANARAFNRPAGFVDPEEEQEDNVASLLSGPPAQIQKRGATGRVFKRPELQARNGTLDNAHMPAVADIPTEEASAPAVAVDARNRFKRPGVDFIDSSLHTGASTSKVGPAPRPPAAAHEASVRAPQGFKWNNGLVHEDTANPAYGDDAPPGLSPAEARRYQQARALRHGQRENVDSHAADVDQMKLQAEAKRKSMLDLVKNKKPPTSASAWGSFKGYSQAKRFKAGAL
eukprot:gene17670-24020_t